MFSILPQFVTLIGLNAALSVVKVCNLDLEYAPIHPLLTVPVILWSTVIAQGTVVQVFHIWYI